MRLCVTLAPLLVFVIIKENSQIMSQGNLYMAIVQYMLFLICAHKKSYSLLQFFLEIQINGSCPGTFDNSKSQYIQYPGQNGNLDDCIWSITSLTDKHIVFNFSEFGTFQDIEKLQIYEGENANGKALYDLSGYAIPSTKSIDAKSLYITYWSRGFGSFKIFLLTSGK